MEGWRERGCRAAGVEGWRIRGRKEADRERGWRQGEEWREGKRIEVERGDG
jgi:hypothetical protein